MDTLERFGRAEGFIGNIDFLMFAGLAERVKAVTENKRLNSQIALGIPLRVLEERLIT